MKEKVDHKVRGIVFLVMSGLFIVFAAITPITFQPPGVGVLVGVHLFLSGLTSMCGVYHLVKARKQSKKEKQKPKDYEPIG